MLYDRLSCVLVFVVLMLVICFNTPINARPTNNKTQEHRIVLPYQRYVDSNAPRYQFPVKPLKENRRVLVPATTDIEMKSTFQLNREAEKITDKSHSSYNGMSVNFVEGAYPVYYMPGNVNGHFNGKISLLVE